MTGRWYEIPPIPRETVRNARAILDPDNFFIQVGERLESVVEEIQPKQLSTNSPEDALLSLVTFFQAVEGFTDVQAVDAIRTRIDWKFALHLPIQSPAFDGCDLCQFRSQVMSDPLRQFHFQKLVDRLCQLRQFVRQAPQASRCLNVLEAVERINRTGHLREAIRHALEALALRYPEWLQKIALPHWYGRYNDVPRGVFDTGRLVQGMFSTKEICNDIDYLLEQIRQSGPMGINDLDQIGILNQIWRQEFYRKPLTVEDETTGAHHCDSCTKSTQRRQAD